MAQLAIATFDARLLGRGASLRRCRHSAMRASCSSLRHDWSARAKVKRSSSDGKLRAYILPDGTDLELLRDAGRSAMQSRLFPGKVFNTNCHVTLQDTEVARKCEGEVVRVLKAGRMVVVEDHDKRYALLPVEVHRVVGDWIEDGLDCYGECHVLAAKQPIMDNE